jgi:glucan phosphoethanolaminetransferase (alkaline phosphatase superfamily)
MKRLTGFLALALVIYSIVMTLAVWGFPKRGPRYQIVQPVLTLELSRDADELSNLLDVDDARGKLRYDTHLDNFFIPTYDAFLLSAIWLIGSGTSGRIRKLFPAAILIAVLAALCDGLENYNIFIALSAPQITDALSAAIRHPSQLKWFFLFTGYLLTALFLLTRTGRIFSQTTTFILAMMLATAGVVGYIGLLFCRNALPVSSLLFAALPILSLRFLRKQKES